MKRLIPFGNPRGLGLGYVKGGNTYAAYTQPHCISGGSY